MSVRETWLEQRSETIRRRTEEKNAQAALFDLYDAYRNLAPEDRPEIDQLLIESVGSPDENVRFDALALIQQFKITAALPALRALADRLETATAPGAPSEWKKVNRVIGKLVEGKPAA